MAEKKKDEEKDEKAVFAAQDDIHADGTAVSKDSVVQARRPLEA